MTDTHPIDAYLIDGTDADVLEGYRTLAQRAAGAAVALVEDEVVVLDTETTGVDPARDALIEIAAVRMRGPDVLDSFQTFVDPGRPIPEEICELTGITDADVRGAPDPSMAVELFSAFAAGCDLVAHNASFDRGFIMRQAASGAISGRWIDTLALSHIALPRFKTHRLADLARAFGAPRSTHRAEDDVRALAVVWRVLLTAVQDMPAGLAGFIAQIASETDWPLRAIFQQAGARSGAEFSLRAARSARVRTGASRPKEDAEEVPLSLPGAAQIREAFSADGVAGAMYADYEQRDEQLAMALDVAEAFRANGVHALEAGTGVGKSMAYLLPAALAARQSAITCGVATKTNALMDQLVYHELPRLARALGGLNYIALKGYEHYPCLRKLERYAAEAGNISRENIEMAATLYAFVAQTSWGDLDAVNLHWFGMQRASIEASPNDCLKSKCPYFPRRCMLHGARRCAASADIVVTNHALLFRDVQMGNGILPPIRHWIVDEAHAVESEARKQLSRSISARELEFLLARLTGLRAGVLAGIRRKAADLSGGDMLYGVTADIDARAAQVKSIATSFFSFVKDLGSADAIPPQDARPQRAAPQDTSAQAGYDRVILWVGPELRTSGAWATLKTTGRSLALKLDGMVKRMKDLVSMLEQFEDALATQQADLTNAACTLQGMAEALTLIIDGNDDSYVYSVQLDRNPQAVAEVLLAAKLDVGAELADEFYPNVMSVVYTSATLAGGDAKRPFSHFMRTSGLDRLDESRVDAQVLASSYDFDQNMAVYLPAGIPEPNAAGYLEKLEELLFEVHRAQGGSVLTLFTNRRDMEMLYRRLKPRMAAEGLDLAAQMRGISTKNLRDRFLEDEDLSLFALRSFWEGFDAPGDTLRCVVIPKLPFGRPTDPIACERQRREGRAAWSRYSLPAAVVDLKQAAGRLIRKSTDRGCLVLADARLQTRRYGRAFLAAMPTKNIHTLPPEEICARLAQQARYNS